MFETEFWKCNPTNGEFICVCVGPIGQLPMMQHGETIGIDGSEYVIRSRAYRIKDSTFTTIYVVESTDK